MSRGHWLAPWLRRPSTLVVQALLWCCVVAFGWGVALPATAQNIESILAPGKLIQGHAKLENDCSQCHVKFDRKAQDGRCMACHKDIGADVRARTGFHGRLKPQACNTCHTDHKGRNARIVELDKTRFDHAQTDFQLRGKHQKVECEKCHVAGKKYSEAPSDCNSCHKRDDVHKGALGPKCADCHSESSWKETRFDHDKTRFSLTGKHADVRCTECHRNNVFKNTPRTCISCHRKDDEQKGHKGQFGEKCETCHGTKAWKPSNFNHDDDTKYALRGKHRSTECTACHKGNLYRIKPSQDCYACHQKDDKHKETLGKDCGSCHTERSWKEPSKFNHDQTSFPLLGGHAKVECKDCHKSTMFKEAPKDCIGCHKKDDKHEGTLGQQCEQCHSERSWKATRFDHGLTRFPLTGKHIAVKCDSCHESNRFKEAPRDCYACHKKEDRHKLKFGEACESCHNTRGWTIWDFDHDKRTSYKLDGAHRKVACQSCHTQLAPKGSKAAELGKNCISCHRKSDVHDGQFGMRCEQCHVTQNWKKLQGRVSSLPQPSAETVLAQMPPLGEASHFRRRLAATSVPPDSARGIP